MNYETKRHKILIQKMNELNTTRSDISKQNQRISLKLGVSITTVYNYTHGLIRDGYLAEDIIEAIIKDNEKYNK